MVFFGKVDFSVHLLEKYFRLFRLFGISSVSQMKHALANLLRAALIPELRTNVAAGSAGNIHLVLVAISAVRAFPNELSAIFDNLNFAVIAADLAIIRLGIQL